MKAIIMQGASGSGKSTFVESNYPDAIVCSADKFFIDAEGNYNFDPSKLGEAHKSSLRAFLEALACGHKLVVCDNTNTQLWEMAPYIQAAAAYGYEVEVIRCVCDPDIAADRNQHGVPGEAVKKMADRLQEPLPFWPCTYREVDTTE